MTSVKLNITRYLILSIPHPTRQRSLVLAIGQQVEHPNAREPLRPERPRRALVREPVTRPAS